VVMRYEPGDGSLSFNGRKVFRGIPGDLIPCVIGIGGGSVRVSVAYD